MHTPNIKCSTFVVELCVNRYPLFYFISTRHYAFI
jgi:hypothetical protein